MLSSKQILWLQVGVSMEAITEADGNTITKMLQGKLETNHNQATDAEYSGVAEVRPNFVLGKSSLKELEGVTPKLVEVVKLAIQLTTQDFTVYDGIRTLKEQEKYVKAGTSKTMKSKHLDGLAVDLVPWVNGKPVWDWDRIYPIVYAMDEAATQLGVASKIRWGGAWDRVLSDFGGEVNAYLNEYKAYADRHPGKDFLDGPHFEWVG